MVLGFAGPAQIGKTTCAQILHKERGFATLSFAAGVKAECVSFIRQLGIPFRRENFYGTIEDKEESLILPQYWKALQIVPEFLGFVYQMNRHDLGSPNVTFTGRQLMQWWGTDYRREQDADYWVKRAMDTVGYAEAAGLHSVIDDVRFPSEVEAIQNIGGKVCYIIRKDRPVIKGAVHESEIALNGFAGFDKHIVNNGTLEMLQDRVLGWCDSLVPRQEV